MLYNKAIKLLEFCLMKKLMFGLVLLVVFTLVAYVFFRYDSNNVIEIEDSVLEQASDGVGEGISLGTCPMWGELPEITAEKCEGLGGEVIAGAGGSCCDSQNFLGTVVGFRSPRICCVGD